MRSDRGRVVVAEVDGLEDPEVVAVGGGRLGGLGTRRDLWEEGLYGERLSRHRSSCWLLAR